MNSDCHGSARCVDEKMCNFRENITQGHQAQKVAVLKIPVPSHFGQIPLLFWHFIGRLVEVPLEHGAKCSLKKNHASASDHSSVTNVRHRKGFPNGFTTQHDFFLVHQKTFDCYISVLSKFAWIFLWNLEEWHPWVNRYIISLNDARMRVWLAASEAGHQALLPSAETNSRQILST